MRPSRPNAYQSPGCATASHEVTCRVMMLTGFLVLAVSLQCRTGVAEENPTDALKRANSRMAIKPGDWPQWGGSALRNNTPAAKDIPIDWHIGDYEYDYRAKGPRQPHHPGGARNIRWVAALGSQTWGNPVVANGRIFIGTNNEAQYVPRYEGDKGVLLCLEEKSGRFLWQHANDKLATGRVNDWPQQGVCSTPVVDGNRLWYVSNRGEVVCLDTEGFHDGEDDGIQDIRFGSEWGRIFTVPAQLHRSLSHLAEEFRAAGTPLSSRLSLRKVDNLWTIGERTRSKTTRRWEWQPHWELQQRAGMLLAAGPVFPPGPRKLLFARPNDFYPLLRRNRFSDAVLQLLSDHEIAFDHESLRTRVNGQIWEFLGDYNGEKRRFQMHLEDGMLTVSKRLHRMEREDADVVWKLDMINQLDVFPHNMSNCSPVLADGTLFVCTSNGVDEAHLEVPNPDAPDFLALDADTGEILWQDSSPSGRVLHGQWASPAYGIFDGQPQVIFPGGDGWVYSFDPHGDGHGGPRLLWKFDGNPKTAVWRLGGQGDRNNIVAFPCIYKERVYITMGQDPEHGEGKGCLWCIDPTKRTDGGDISPELVLDLEGNPITAADRFRPRNGLRDDERTVPNPMSAVIWSFTGEDLNGDGKTEGEEVFHRSLSSPVIRDDILYAPDLTGYFHCLDADSGRSYWNYDLFASCWSSALIAGDYVYLGNEDGVLHVFRHSGDRRIALADEVTQKDGDGHMVEMDNCIYTTPVVANGVLYVATRNSLFAIQQTATE